jgi:hypothetical protein
VSHHTSHQSKKDALRSHQMAEQTVEISRGSLLQGAGWLLAASALPSFPFALNAGAASPAAPGTISPVMTRLSDYMADAAAHALPAGVIDKMQQHILDTLAAMISGSELPPGMAAIKFARAYGGSSIGTVVGSNVLCGPIESAMTNGMLAHSVETDDSHAPSQCHPGCAIVPAALAAAEQFGISGTHFVRAVAPGYDVGTRVTMTLGGIEFMADTHHST